MKIIQHSAAFEIIGTFGIIPDFSEKEIFIHWLTKAGLTTEAKELEALDENYFLDLFTHFLQIYRPAYLQ